MSACLSVVFTNFLNYLFYSHDLTLLCVNKVSLVMLLKSQMVLNHLMQYRVEQVDLVKFDRKCSKLTKINQC